MVGLATGSKEVAETNKNGLCLGKDGQPDITEMPGRNVNAQAPDCSPSQFVEDEKRQEGSMQWMVWKAYFTTGAAFSPGSG